MFALVVDSIIDFAADSVANAVAAMVTRYIKPIPKLALNFAHCAEHRHNMQADELMRLTSQIQTFTRLSFTVNSTLTRLRATIQYGAPLYSLIGYIRLLHHSTVIYHCHQPAMQFFKLFAP